MYELHEWSNSNVRLLMSSSDIEESLKSTIPNGLILILPSESDEFTKTLQSKPLYTVNRLSFAGIAVLSPLRRSWMFINQVARTKKVKTLLTNILNWTRAANKNAKTAKQLLNMILCNGFLTLNLAMNGYRTELSVRVNINARKGFMVCIWSGLISQSIPCILPFMRVACNVQREPCWGSINYY